MRDHNHLKNEFEFTEELPYADGVLAKVSRDRIQQKMQMQMQMDKLSLRFTIVSPFHF